MKQKINLRLGFIALLAIITTTIGVTLVYYNLFQKQVREDLKQNAILLIETEVFQKAYLEKNNSAENLKKLELENIRITWIDADGTVLFDNDTDVKVLGNHLDRPEIQLAVKDGEGESTRRSDTMNMNTFYYATLLENGTILRVSMRARNITNVLLEVFPVLLVIVAAILLGCVLIGHLLTLKLMKPLEMMAENIEDANVEIYKELEPFAKKIRLQHENILAAAKSRQDFTANVSHELKTPITAISGYAELIENHLYDDESEVHIARQIRHNSDRLLSLINDIIKLSELDHMEIVRKFETVDLYSIVSECVNELKPLAAKKTIELKCSGCAAGINADKSLIREMVENLVQNAIRYNKDNGSVKVCVEIKNEHPILTVEDTGIGIPADQLDRVFERFYRVDKGRSREKGGTGLGLAIVKHIAELHSAKISINSLLGEGTKIEVRF